MTTTTKLTTEEYRRKRAEIAGKRAQVVAQAGELARTAEGREFTGEEQSYALDLKAAVDAADRAITELDAGEQRRRDEDEQARFARKAGDERIRAAVAALGEGLDDPATTEPVGRQPRGAAGAGYKASAPTGPVMSRSAWVKAALDRIEDRTRAAGGRKDLIQGGVLRLPSPVTAEVVAMPDRPTRVLDLITNRPRLDGDGRYSFPRQISRDRAAAVVPDGGLKPRTSPLVVDVESQTKVVALISSPFPRRYITDYGVLLDFLSLELEGGITDELENLVVSGDGAADRVTDTGVEAVPDGGVVGVLNTSGVLVQSWAGDMFTSARRAVTAMEMTGERPTAWAVAPADRERLDLTREDGTTGGFLASAAGASNVFGNLPIVSAPSLPAGTAVLADWTRSLLAVREDVDIRFNEYGELFRKNEIEALCEGRFDFQITRPSAFCIVALAAPPTP